MRLRRASAALPASSIIMAMIAGAIRDSSAPVVASWAGALELCSGVVEGAVEGGSVEPPLFAFPVLPPPGRVAVPESTTVAASYVRTVKLRSLPTLIEFAAKVMEIVRPAGNKSDESSAAFLSGSPFEATHPVSVAGGVIPENVIQLGHVELKLAVVTKDQPVGRMTRNSLALAPVATVAETVIGVAFVPVVPMRPDEDATTFVSEAAYAAETAPSGAIAIAAAATRVVSLRVTFMSRFFLRVFRWMCRIGQSMKRGAGGTL